MVSFIQSFNRIIILYYLVDWAAKRELFISIMLRAYSQGKIDPEAIYNEDISESSFVEKVENLLKEFIVNDIAADSSGI